MRIVFDIDFVLFAAASVAEETFITVTHTPTGMVQEFENRTQLWGHHGKKNTGWIGTQNALSKNDYYKSEDFIVVEGQRLRPFRVKGLEGKGDTFLSPMDGAKKAVTDKINAVCVKLKTRDYFGFTGRGDVFRHELATLLPYKGNRSALKPLLLEELKDWACETHNITMVTGVEADDAVSMATVKGYKAWKSGGEFDEDMVVACGIDKDAKQSDGFHFNPDKDDSVRLVEGFGSLWLTEKGDVDGSGRMWLYYQISVGDTVDNYKANCFSDIKWASKGGYSALKDCTTDREAWTALVQVFKKLYPEKKVVAGCKGDVEIDAYYVLQEMADMAFMLRHNDTPRDRIDVRKVLTKLGIEHGN